MCFHNRIVPILARTQQATRLRAMNTKPWPVAWAEPNSPYTPRPQSAISTTTQSHLASSPGMNSRIGPPEKHRWMVGEMCLKTDLLTSLLPSFSDALSDPSVKARRADSASFVSSRDLHRRVESARAARLTAIAQRGSSLFPMEWLLGMPERFRAKRCPGSGPLPASRVSGTHPNPRSEEHT